MNKMADLQEALNQATNETQRMKKHIVKLEKELDETSRMLQSNEGTL